MGIADGFDVVGINVGFNVVGIIVGRYVGVADG